MMTQKTLSRVSSIALCLLLCFALSVSVLAAGTCRTGTATGHYRNPQTDEIEDSGGEENEALGQSMVDNVVADQALLEEVDGQYYMTVRFNLASNLSSIDIYTQEVGETEWTTAATTVTGEGDDTRDIRFPVKGEDTIVRAECFVDAMGRAVIFFITVSDYTDGNSTEYAEMTEADAAQAAAGTTASETAAAETTFSDSADDLLDGVEGLTIGGTDTASAVEETETETAASAAADTQAAGEQENTVDAATLILAKGTWWRIFLVAFCGCFLAGLVLQGLTRLTAALTGGSSAKKGRKHASGRSRYAEDPDDENGDILSDDLWGDDDEV